MIKFTKTLLRLNFRPMLIKAPLKFFSEGKKPFEEEHLTTKQQKQYNEKMMEDAKNQQMKEGGSTGYILIGGAMILTMAYILMQMQSLRGEKKVNKFRAGKVEGIGKADIGGEWSLIDTKGNTVTNKDFEGCYYLIYFGFCNCPDICPNSLTKLKKALEKIRKVPQGKLFKLKSIFVSVDPDRDTPQKIQKFLSYFDKQMIGLTAKSNNDPALKDCMKKFKIYSSKIQYEQQDGETKKYKNAYTIDHTILTYLIDDQNNYMTHLGANMGEHQLAKTIIQKVMQNQRKKY